MHHGHVRRFDNSPTILCPQFDLTAFAIRYPLRHFVIRGSDRTLQILEITQLRVGPMIPRAARSVDLAGLLEWDRTRYVPRIVRRDGIVTK